MVLNPRRACSFELFPFPLPAGTHTLYCFVCLWVANQANETHFVQVRILTGVTVHLAPDILTSGVGSIDSDAHVRSGL